MTTQRASTLPPTTCRAAQRRTATQRTSVPKRRPHGQPGLLDQGQREHLLAAAAELSLALLREQPTDEVLQLIATRARQAAMAALALVGRSTDRDVLVVEAAAGPDSDWLLGQPVRLTPMPTAALALDLGDTAGGGRRVLVLLGLPAASRTTVVRALLGFAEHVTAALGLADRRADVERERLLQDRERPATALLELVVPRLFGAGLRLAGADGLIRCQPEQARARVSRAVQDLDLAIADVRAAALRLRTAPTQAHRTPGAVQAPAPCSFWRPSPAGQPCDDRVRLPPGRNPTGPRLAGRPPRRRQHARRRRRAGDHMVTAIRQAAVSALEPGQDRSRPPSRVAHSRTGERVKASHPNQAAHGCGGSDPAPEQVRRQFVADLLHALPGVSGHIVAALDAVLLLACTLCPSCVAVSLTVDHETQPVTITATRSAGHRDAASLTVRLPRPTTGEPARQPAVLVVFATDPVALAGLGDDVTALLEIDPGRITLAAAAAVPQKTVDRRRWPASRRLPPRPRRPPHPAGCRHPRPLLPHPRRTRSGTRARVRATVRQHNGDRLADRRS